MTSFFTRLSRWLWLLALCCGALAPARAQDRQRLPCGNPDLTTEQTKAFATYIKQAEAGGQQLRKAAVGITYFGIKPWVVKNSGYWQTENIVLYINKLNEDFAPTHLQFFIVSGGIGTITATTSQTLSYPADEASLLNQNFDATAINVYFGDRVYSCGTTCRGIGGICPGLTDAVTITDRSIDIPNPNLQAKKDDYILISQYSSSNTLSHEMGHYFGLLHTFQGSAATTCDDRERPIGTRSAGDSDRGDLIDDTDADPYPLYTTPPFNETTCAYTGNLLHCNTNWPVRTFTPPVNNIMSYWSGGGFCSDRQGFTPHQTNRTSILLSARFNPTNQYNLASGVQGISTAPTVSLSISGTNRLIQVTGLPGALGYILETANDIDFANPIIIGFTSVTATLSFTDNEVPPAGTIYYYRVRATNSKTYSRILSYPCNAPTATLTGSQTVTNGQSATFTVALTGNPSWNVQVGGSTYSNVTSSPLSIVTPPYPALQQTYTQTTTGGSVTNACGTAPMSGTASVTVIGTCPSVPTLILHNDIGCGQLTAYGTILIAGVDYVQGNPVPYTIQWKNVTTGVSYTVNAIPTIVSFFEYAVYGIYGYTYFGKVINLPVGQYNVDVTDRNGCPTPRQSFTISDYGPNGPTATLSGPANNRIPKGQQTSIRVELTGTAPWSVTYSGRGNKQYVASNITTPSYDIAVAPDSTTTYRLVALNEQCNASSVSGSATLIVVPALNQLEYFVDTDPGIGRATSVAVGVNQTTTDQSFTVPIAASSLTGVHVVGVRAKDADGYWSPTTLRPYVVFGNLPTYPKDILYVRYQLDNGSILDRVSPVNNNEPIAIPVSVSLSPGVHLLTVWAYDKRDVQSGYVSRPFVVFGTGSTSGSAITQVEYYVDTDPGVGQATSVAYTAAPGVPFSLSISQGLAPGTHTLLVRAKDGSNRWSVSYVRSFMVAPAQGNISRIEYFFDSSDPGLGTAPTLAFSPANSGTVTANQDITAPLSLSAGVHKLVARTQTTAGIWSVTKAASFTVTPCITPLATISGSYTTTTDQPLSLSVGLGGSPPFSLTANGQVQTTILTNTATVSLPLTSPGTYTLTPQSLSLSVANGCGLGLTSGQIRVTVQQGTCAIMQTVKAGLWDDPTVWSCGRLPLLTRCPPWFGYGRLIYAPLPINSAER